MSDIVLMVSVWSQDVKAGKDGYHGFIFKVLLAASHQMECKQKGKVFLFCWESDPTWMLKAHSGRKAAPFRDKLMV